jgi:membrane protein YqaA with SNARE-associated domain
VSKFSLTRWFRWIRGPDARSAADHVNLRRWFAAFVLWMTALAATGVLSFQRVELGLSANMGVWLVALSMFYLSLCCLFCPLPTSWVVLLLASDAVNLATSLPLRVVLVSVLCASATAMANLNEYHIVTFMLRYRAVGRVRNARFYQRAASWFAVAPFVTITAISFIPIPVDVVRVLSIAARYPRVRFAGAYFVGRALRYALLAFSSAGLNLKPWHIAVIQAGLVLLAGLKVAHAALTRNRPYRDREEAVPSVPQP